MRGVERTSENWDEKLLGSARQHFNLLFVAGSVAKGRGGKGNEYFRRTSLEDDVTKYKALTLLHAVPKSLVYYGVDLHVSVMPYAVMFILYQARALSLNLSAVAHCCLTLYYKFCNSTQT